MIPDRSAIDIREYRPADLEGVVQIFRSNIPKYFGSDEEDGLRHYLNEFPNDYFVFEIGNEIIGSGGFALNSGDEPTVSLCWGMVARTAWERGWVACSRNLE